MFFEKRNNLWIGRFAGLFGDSRLMHAFSTRGGGVSRGCYASLNLGENTGDVFLHVEENRRRFFNETGVTAPDLVIPEQVHGGRVMHVQSGGRVPECDGVITGRKDVVLSVQVADCVPVFLRDPVRKVVGLIHAGRAGTEQHIVRNAVRLMISDFRSDPSDMLAFLGPSIGPFCYEVSREMASCFPGRYVSGRYLDLWRYNADQLMASGLKKSRIESSRLCTACHPEWFFSHRAGGGRTGRMMAVLAIR